MSASLIRNVTLADLLLVAGDPLTDIAATRPPALVMKAGRVVRNDVGSAVALGS